MFYDTIRHYWLLYLWIEMKLPFILIIDKMKTFWVLKNPSFYNKMQEGCLGFFLDYEQNMFDINNVREWLSYFVKNHSSCIMLLKEMQLWNITHYSQGHTNPHREYNICNNGRLFYCFIFIYFLLLDTIDYSISLNIYVPYRTDLNCTMTLYWYSKK